MGFRFFEKNKVICVLAAATCLLMMAFPEITVGASKAAIRIWMNAVVPSLLPFMIAAGCIKMTGAKAVAESRYYPILMAFLSGYPMGARLTAQLYKENLISGEDAQHILHFSNNESYPLICER